MIIPLKTFLNRFLRTFKIKNIFTGKNELADDIFDWKMSKILSIMINDGTYYVDDSCGFTTDSKDIREVITIEKQKTNKKKKVIEIKETETKKYRYIKIPIYETIIKRRKIGKKYYYTTEYKLTNKYQRKRQYYTVKNEIKKVKYIPIYKKIKTVKKIEYKEYEPLLVWDYYKGDINEEVLHQLYISPFYEEYGTPYYITNADETYCQPQEIPDTENYKRYIWFCRTILHGYKLRKYDKKTVQEMKSRIYSGQEIRTLDLTDSDKMSKDILDFFVYTNTRTPNNKKVVEEKI